MAKLPETKTVNSLVRELKKLGTPERAKASAWFFKTGKGEYGEGDKFLGISVPVQRRVARRYKALQLPAIKKLLQSKIHEHRFVALEILVMRYEEGDAAQKKLIAQFFLKNTKCINNWDLVDTSASYILGDYLLTKDRSVLYKLAASRNIWQRRIAIIASGAFIREKQYQDTLQIAEMLLNDKHDLIHKAVGWMLREVGNRSMETEVEFLDKHYRSMPRTMLRYAIEKFPPAKRKHYLSK
jgi:3-methyladenine DNA glycosylase AlkD